MSKTRLFNKTLLAAAVTLAATQVQAAGFQLNSQSGTGIGRAFAGDAVIADNASSMARNAATMALFDKTSMSLGLVSITSMIEVKDAKYVSAVNPGGLDSNESDAGTTSFPPNIHIIVPVNDKFAWGVNAYSNFGTRTEFSDDFVGSEYGGETEIVSANFGLAGSYRINEQWSVGAGIDFIYGQGTLKRNLSSSLPAPFGGAEAMDIDGADGWGTGYNIGTVYEHNENNRYGLAYRYSPDITAKDGDKEVSLPLPDMLEFSGFHKIENTKFAVHYSAQFIRWSEFDELDFNFTNSVAYKWKDTYHISLGGTYYLNKKWTLRAGYMYDESAQDKVTSFSVPDSDRNWFSTGFTYNLNEKSNIDFGFTYLIGKNVDVSQENTGVSSMTGTTHTDAILLGLQYSRTF